MITNHTTDELSEMLVFQIGRKEFCISLSEICAIVKPEECIRSSPEIFYKYLSLENYSRKIPLMDIHATYGEFLQEPLGEKRILLISIFSKLYGFWIDSIKEIISVNSKDKQPLDRTLAANKNLRYLGTVEYGKKIILIPDLKKIVIEQITDPRV